MKENLTKAAQTADLLFQDIREAHKISIAASDWAAEMLISDMLKTVAEMRSRLELAATSAP